MLRLLRTFGLACLLLAGAVAPTVRAQARAQPPSGPLPRYDVEVLLDVAARSGRVHESVTWTNRAGKPVRQIVFNAHAHYQIPDKDIGLLAKTLELLRMTPKEAMNFEGPVLRMEGVRTTEAEKVVKELSFHFPEDNATALVVDLPRDVWPGEAITLELDFTLHLPAKKGRWGQWDGITTLAQWLPVVAVHDDERGWQPTPFIPWHQPYFNEAGHYTVRVKLAAEQKLAASAPVQKETDLGNGYKEVEFAPVCVRDFALVASARFQEWTGDVDGVHIRCLALPHHAFYGQALVDAAKQALPVYNRWFGKYPYAQFTIVESCFGWNGNECGALVMIDDRMFNMPHIAKQYPIYLLQHELCHQWWYNVVGTNGFAETWMDEGLATYFSHRLANETMGTNNAIIEWPKGLGWLPNIRREDLRNCSMVGAWARGEGKPCVVADMPEFGHLVNLTSAAYDRGGKVIGLIEERMGEAAFLDFMRLIYRKYQFRILRVADFRAELEQYTGRSWEDFFQHWVYGNGRCDWAVERVEINERRASFLHRPGLFRKGPVHVVVHVCQQGEFNEPTTLGIRLQDGSEYQVRVPLHPDVPVLNVPDVAAVVHCFQEVRGGKPYVCAKVEIDLPCEPVQVSVDPDHMLIDACPTNNHWRLNTRWHLTPLYTQLDEIDVSNAHDRWNIHMGPWVFFSSYKDPWYTKSEMLGLRLSAYRTQEVDTAAYLAYRANDRNVVAGADILWDHVPLPHMQLGLNVEQSVASLNDYGPTNSRGVLFARYILMYGSALYLPPFEYVETFAQMRDRALPELRNKPVQFDPFDQRPSLGIHYHKNMMTPYWDAEGGYALDMTYQYGLPIFGNDHAFHEIYGQFAFVKPMPKLPTGGHDGPFLRWLHDTRFAFRVAGAAGLPDRGLLFPLGGGDYFRGFDLSERQGSLMWLGSVEWRLPIATNLPWDFCDHLVGIRHIYLAPFYDIGNSYLNGHPLGPIAHAVGVGLRVDVTWLGLIERTMVRFDVAKNVSNDAPLQFWFGIQHPF